jgi:outer membrane protein OmpA-like peptidoglycan-associated protein
MDKQQRELEQIDNAEVERIDEETLRISFDSDILFAVDSAVLSADSMRSLDDFAQVMQEYPKTAILVQGYTDSTGTEQHNQYLSERRAQSVEKHLALRGVDGSRMNAVGYGEGYPVADNATSQGRSQNRRVEILVKGKA